MNVDMADATLVFRLYKSKGTDLTIDYCRKSRQLKEGRKVHPLYVISDLSLISNPDHRKITCCSVLEFLKIHRVKKLNIAGHRFLDSTETEHISAFLNELFGEIQKE
jgi:hypothetical protein